MQDPDQPGERASIYGAPQEFVRRAFQSWESFINQYSRFLQGDQQALDPSGRTVEGVTRLKQQVDRAVEIAVSSMQMPTKSDMEAVLQKLTSLENLVRDLNEKVDELVERQEKLESRPRRQPRTKEKKDAE